MKSDTSRRVAGIAQLASWMGTAGSWSYALSQYNPPTQYTPQWVWLVFMLLLGISVALTFVRERMRLQDSIISAFVTGMQISNDHNRKGKPDEDTEGIQGPGNPRARSGLDDKRH